MTTFTASLIISFIIAFVVVSIALAAIDSIRFHRQLQKNNEAIYGTENHRSSLEYTLEELDNQPTQETEK